MIIRNEKAAGKFTGGFKYTVLELIENEGVACVDYAAPEYENYRPGKMNPCTMEVDAGWVLGGYSKHRLEEVGPVDEILAGVRKVVGKTYDIKEKIKARGFTWDRGEKAWVKR